MQKWDQYYQKSWSNLHVGNSVGGAINCAEGAESCEFGYTQEESETVGGTGGFAGITYFPVTITIDYSVTVGLGVGVTSVFELDDGCEMRAWLYEISGNLRIDGKKVERGTQETISTGYEIETNAIHSYDWLVCERCVE